MTGPPVDVAGLETTLDELRQRRRARDQARTRELAADSLPKYDRFGMPQNTLAELQDDLSFRRQRREEQQHGIGLTLATVRTFANALVPERFSDAAQEENLNLAAKGGALGRTLIRGTPDYETSFLPPAGPGGMGVRLAKPMTVHGRPDITSEDVLGAASTAGTATKEYLYMKGLGRLTSMAAAPLFRGAAALEARAAPKVTQYLTEWAGRSTTASRVASGVSSAARGGVEAAGFGAGREAIESGEPERGLGYAPYGLLAGGILGGVTARTISPSRVLTSPSDAARSDFATGQKDPFRVLGLTRETATAETIDEAFKARAVRWHPDVNPDPDATGIFQMYSAARTAALDELKITAPEAAPAPETAAPERPVPERAPVTADKVTPPPAEAPSIVPMARRAGEPASGPVDLEAIANEARDLSARVGPAGEAMPPLTPEQRGRLKELSAQLVAAGETMEPSPVASLAARQTAEAAAERRQAREPGEEPVDVERRRGEERRGLVPRPAGAPEAVAGQPGPAARTLQPEGQANPKFQKLDDAALEARFGEVLDRMQAAMQVRQAGTNPWVRQKPEGGTVSGTSVTGEAGRAEGRARDDQRILKEIDAEFAARGIDAQEVTHRYVERTPEISPIERATDEEFEQMLQDLPGAPVPSVGRGEPTRAAGAPADEAAMQGDLLGKPTLVGQEQTELLSPTAGVPTAKLKGTKIGAEEMARVRREGGEPEGARPLELEAQREVPRPAPAEPAGQPAEGLPAAGAGGPAERVPGRRGGGGEAHAPQPGGAAEEKPAVQPGTVAGPADLGEVPEPGGEGDRPPRPGAGAGAVHRESAGERGRGTNYRIGDADRIGAGGIGAKVRGNIDAISLLKTIEARGTLATPEEQAQLVKFVGWGGAPQVFDEHNPDWTQAHRDLRALLTEDEWRAAKASTPNAHYTSQTVIEAMWQALRRLGYAGGRALEPSAGVGHFLGLVPSNLPATKFTAIELDSITGRIARQLYPQSDVRVAGFEETALPDGFYDVAISNVPFGDYKVADPRYEKYPFSIHEYFFAKALDKVRPGGVVAFITSRYTMDKKSTSVRRYLADRANLLGAVRLPWTAFEKNANTKVTTDILFLQKREPGEAASGESWLELTGGAHPINEYFAAHPQMVAGKHGTVRGQYRKDEYQVVPVESESLHTALERAIGLLPADVMAAPVRPVVDLVDGTNIEAPETVKDGAFTMHEGKLMRRRGKDLVPAGLAETKAAVVRSMIPVRDAAREVLRAQLTGQGEPEVLSTQKKLRETYDRFVKKHGYVNRTVRSSSGAERRPNVEAFSDDPDAPLMAALEQVDSDTGAITKAPIFSERVIRLQPKIEKADRPTDALLASLNEKGRVDVARIAELLGTDDAHAVEALAGQIFEDPESRQWETAEKYLSGDVRKKLAIAKTAAGIDAKYRDHVAALEAVQPEDVPPEAIEVRLGSPWVPTTDMEQFVRDVLGESRYGENLKITHLASEGAWALTIPYDVATGIPATKEWGTMQYPAGNLIEDALNQRVPTVYHPGEPRTVNTDETLAAREMQSKIKDRFRAWLWEDPTRAKRLHRYYNDHFNSMREAKADGAHLTLPGASTSIVFRPHQKNAVWRILQHGNTLLAHVVGAGKTYAMAAAGMEARRTGLARKPLYTVPNHMLEQWGREFAQLYPAAKLLLATEDEFAAARRKEFTAKIATGDWDAVIMTHSSFTKVPVSRAFEETFIKEQLARYEELYAEARESRSRDLTKLIEKAKKRLEVRLKQLANRKAKDDVLSFEELGVDMLFVDEADMFKNLEAPTKMRNVGIAASQRATDMFLKTRYLNQVNPGHGVVFATATPIANSIVEAFTMQRYLQPQLLADQQIEHLDGWAPAFGDHVTAMELAPDGSGYRSHTRFARFHNIPELNGMFRQVADVQTAEMLKLPVPKVRGGKPAVVSAQGTRELKAYVANLVERAKAVKSRAVSPEEDNMLKITTDGRKAALDMRIINPNLPDDPGSKVNLAVDRIHEIWQDTARRRSTQLVFIDLSTPKRPGEGFSVYNDMKAKLLDRGIPAAEVAFIHDADTKAKQGALFRQVREGKVRVLFGSTEKMGAGVNVQDRLIAAHHVDAPWRPRDIEQRDGRIVRQGNENEEVQVLRYVTESSFDAYMWQILAIKGRFIDQFMLAEIGVRTIEDVDSRALTYDELKAIASGNPLVLEKATVDAEVARLGRLQRAYRDSKFETSRALALLPEQIAHTEERIRKIEADAKKVVDTTGDKFALTLGSRTYTDRAEAAPVLLNKIASAQVLSKEHGHTTIGEFAGFPLRVEVHRPAGRPPRVYLSGGEDYETEVPLETSPAGALQATEYLTKRLTGDLEKAKITLVDRQKRLADLERIKDEPFEHAGKLLELQAKQTMLNDKLDLNKNQADEGEDEPAEIPAEDSAEAIDPPSAEPIIAKLETDAGGAEQVVAAAESRGNGFRQRLLDKLSAFDITLPGDIETLPDEALVAFALDQGVLDNVTAKDLLEQLGQFVREKGAGLSTIEVDIGPPAEPPVEAGKGRVIADLPPRGVGVVEGWLMPSRRVALRLMHSKRADLRVIGQKLYDIVRAGQAAQLNLSRLIGDGGRLELRLQHAIAGLSPADQGRLGALLDTYEDALPEGTPANIEAAFKIMRDGYKQDLRDLAANERLMISERSRDILDEALRQWPEGTDAPDFDQVPINTQNILAAAKRASDEGLLTRARDPQTRPEWEALVQDLKDLKKRVQRPVFMESPDLRRIYRMTRGEGRINYFPHVFMGDWVVRAADKTARFVDRMDAINYARQLLETGMMEGDILVQRDAFIPEASLFLSRDKWLKLKSALEREVEGDAATVSKGMGAAGIRVQPRRRFFSHLQERKVNLQTFERDFAKANRVYNYRLARKLAFDPFRKVALDLKETLPMDGGWRSWAESYIADVQGVPQEWVEQLNHTISLLTLGRVKPMALQRASSLWQKAMSLMYLGYSVPTAIANLTQTAINTIPSFEKHGHYWVWRGLKELLAGSAESLEVLDHVGIAFQHPKYMVSEFMPRGITLKDTAWFAPMYLFNKTEDFNRSIAALAKYYEQKAAGKAKPEALTASSELVSNTQFDYSMADAPRIMRNPLGRTFLQFKLFSVNELFFAEDLFRWGNKRQRATFFSYLFLLGGLRLLALGTPLFLLNWLLGGAQIPGTEKRPLPSLFHDKEGHKITPWDKLWEEIGPVDGKAMLTALKYGLFGLFGVNMSERLGFGGPREFSGSLPGRQLASAVTALTAKTQSERLSGLRDIIPVVFKRLENARRAAAEGQVRDRYGNVVSQAPTPADITMMALGFQTTAAAERSERISRERGEKARYIAERQNWLDDAAAALREHGVQGALDVIRKAKAEGVMLTFKEVQQYKIRRDEPDVRGRIRATPRALREELFTPEERRAYPNRRGRQYHP